MKKAYEIIRPDKCLICKGERSIELYDIKELPLYYSKMVDTKNTSNLNGRKLSYFYCNNCDTFFPVDHGSNWHGLPRPLTERKFNSILSLFYSLKR